MNYANEFDLMNGELKVKVVLSEEEEEEEEVNCETDYSSLVKNGRVRIPAYCDVFIKKYKNLEYCNGEFYNDDGLVSEDDVQQEVYDDVSRIDEFNTPKTAKLIVAALKIQAHTRSNYSPRIDRIPLIDSELMLEGEDSNKEFVLYEKKQRARYRLPISLTPTPPATPYFDKWLHDLFYEDDIPTIQEMIGYCLVPTTAAQKCFILLGDGGQGKSVLRSVLSGLLGDACIDFHIRDLDNNRFSTARLADALVAFDEDITDKGMDSTEILKKVVSVDEKLLVEKKYKDGYEISAYARIIACGNNMLTSLHDTTNGFYRRLLPIITKPKDPNRVDIRDLGKKIKAEANGILPWALIGLRRLIKNKYVFSQSERSKKVIDDLQTETNNVEDFVYSDLEFAPEKSMTTKEIYEAYRLWCKDNLKIQYGDMKLKDWLKNHAAELGLRPSENIISRSSGKRARGYRGVGLKIDRLTTTITIKSSEDK